MKKNNVRFNKDFDISFFSPSGGHDLDVSDDIISVNFKTENEAILNIDMTKIADYSDNGCFFIFLDIAYPKSLYDKIQFSVELIEGDIKKVQFYDYKEEKSKLHNIALNEPENTTFSYSDYYDIDTSIEITIPILENLKESGKLKVSIFEKN